MTRSEYLTRTTIVAGVLFAVGSAFWYFGAPAIEFALAGMNVSIGLDAILLLPAAFVAGADIARRALVSLRSRTLGIELLVTLAAIGAIALGEFFEAAAVTFLFALGGMLENGAMHRTRDALKNLWESVPTTATVVTDEGEKVVAAKRVNSGDMVLVRPGERIPVDGTVDRGESSVDESTITGESVPSDKSAGAKAYSATVNQQGALYIVAERVGSDTAVARIIARVEEAQDSRTKSERVIDRFARYYTPAVVIGSGIYFLITGNVHVALTLLVVACPGALVIAAPVAVISSIGRSARRGVLVRGGSELEASSHITLFATDKTGTLTTGRLRVAGVTPSGEPVSAPATSQAMVGGTAGAGGAAAAPATSQAFAGSGSNRTATATAARTTAESTDADAVLAWAAIAEAASEHPIGKAIRAAGEAASERLPQGEDFRYEVGSGVSSSWDGHEVRVERAGGNGEATTRVAVGVDGVHVGTISLSDTVRPDAAEAIAQLHKSGIGRTVLLTGDSPEVAAAVAEQVGIDEVYAGLVPDEKLEYIRKWQSEGEHVAMLGDGINDAPSLAAADVGIAMGAAGSDLAVESADLALMSEHLTAIPDALGSARRTLSVIRQNLGVAVATVAFLFAGVLMGEIHMAGGMLIHQASILIVIANGVRLRR